MSAVSSPPVQLESWVSFLRAHAAITRELSAQLQREHDLTLNDYEVLLHLSRADGGRMRRVDLAERVVLTASGITRLLEVLERSGFVERAACPTDRRVVYAKLTADGNEKLQAARETHLAGVHRLFIRRYTGSELAGLSELLERLPGASPENGETDC